MAGTAVTPRKLECFFFFTEFCWIHQLLLQTMSNKLIETTATHCQRFLQIWHHSIMRGLDLGTDYTDSLSIIASVPCLIMVPVHLVVVGYSYSF